MNDNQASADNEVQNIDLDTNRKKHISKEFTEQFRIAIFSDNPNMNKHDKDAA